MFVRKASFWLAVWMAAASITTAIAIFFVGWGVVFANLETPSYVKGFFLATTALIFAMGTTKAILGLRRGAFWKWGSQQTLWGWISHLLNLATDIMQRCVPLEMAILVAAALCGSFFVTIYPMLALTAQLCGDSWPITAYTMSPLVLLAIESLDYLGMLNRGETINNQAPRHQCFDLGR